MTSEDKYSFQVVAVKKNGDRRDKTYPKINHAIRALWRMRDVKEGYVYIHSPDGGKYKLLAKIGRRRGILRFVGLKIPAGRPPMKLEGHWTRLPNRFNDLK